jgi:hypothetical protein
MALPNQCIEPSVCQPCWQVPFALRASVAADARRQSDDPDA